MKKLITISLLLISTSANASGRTMMHTDLSDQMFPTMQASVGFQDYVGQVALTCVAGSISFFSFNTVISNYKTTKELSDPYFNNANVKVGFFKNHMIGQTIDILRGFNNAAIHSYATIYLGSSVGAPTLEELKFAKSIFITVENNGKVDEYEQELMIPKEDYQKFISACAKQR